MLIPLVRVKRKEDGQILVINLCDFDEDKYLFLVPDVRKTHSPVLTKQQKDRKISREVFHI